MIHSPFADHAARRRATGVAFAMLAVLATSHAYPVLAQQTTQQTFPSAAEASQSLFRAVQSRNGQAIESILGGPLELFTTPDEKLDSLEREVFLQKYQEMHRLARGADESAILYIGAENWPFPIPLVATNGAWHFDSEAGLKEVLFRRIGENELTAIEICHELVAAGTERARSTAAVEAESALASVVSRWAGEVAVSSDPVLIHGYYFHRLAALPRNGSGPHSGGSGFGFIAYPAVYRSSGVMTFVVSENGAVYEKDLGPNTPALAADVVAFRKDATWRLADQ
jgi:hypothetical protein